MSQTIVSSITDEQLEELEQHVNRVDHAGTDMVETDFNEQRALLARLRAAEKDAARYRWLAGQAELESYGGCEYALPTVHAWLYKPGGEPNQQMETFEEAIDAAMEQQP